MTELERLATDLEKVLKVHDMHPVQSNRLKEAIKALRQLDSKR